MYLNCYYFLFDDANVNRTIYLFKYKVNNYIVFNVFLSNSSIYILMIMDIFEINMF